MFRRDPVRRLLGDEELTPRLAKVLTQIASERSEPNFGAMLNQMNSLELKSLRDELPGRVEQYELEIAEHRRELQGYQPPPYVRPHGRLGLSPSGAIIDLDEREQNGRYEQDRAQSLAARAENERVENEHAAAERGTYEQHRTAAAERQLDAWLRRGA